MQIGWDVETAYEAGLHIEKDDTVLLIYARNNDRILLTFDKLEGEQGCKVSRELRQNGGRVVRINGGPSQNEHRVLGKILFHYPDWNPWLKKHQGIVIIADIRKQSCICYTPREYHCKYHQTDAKQFETYLKHRITRTYKKRGRKPVSPPDGQATLGL